MIHVIFFENMSITLMFDPLDSKLTIISFNFILEFENTLYNYFSKKLLQLKMCSMVIYEMI
jgi:hypothetical protein